MPARPVDRDPPGALLPTEGCDLLREQDPAWDKTALDFDRFRNRIDDALRRAEQLDAPPEGNPSTGVGEIIAALR
ncbi:hypothetical protein [Micromonospora sp. DT233]|uniref:hypothetical protein n=1 Tax=Micromonospora sp. DT233 TaxID=3393432 RepID=UPI003CE898B2